ncbi:MAG: DUF1295 domain-containing protein [Pirellulales bacterium]|nr:DUF1295 domain-containing protein [Pirellulales bacterium]
MTLLETLLINLFAVLALFATIWLISLLRSDASIVDLFWGLGFVFVAWLTWWNHRGSERTSILLLTMVSLWGLRLSGYLAWRNWGKPEDYRYQAMRAKHGPRFPLVSLATVFVLQGFLTWVISWPVQVGIAVGSGMSFLPWIGVILWACGLFFEAVGDFQLARFKANPDNQGKVLNSGLWRYTRHPNYFGDFLVWWGIYLVAAEPGSWWWTVVGPLLMSFLLIRVSGVRLLESSLRSRVTGYEQYVAETSAFFPFPPKRVDERSHS